MSNQENISKETKKTRRKKSQRKSQQIKLAVIMIMVSVLVLSASTFAWYQLNNTANVTNMEFTAQTMGKLQISDSNEDGANAGVYENSLNLADASDKLTANKVLLPSTTPDGMNFYYPMYKIDGTEVLDVAKIEDGKLGKYVYKKVFYLLAGEENSTNPKTYDLKLDAGTKVDDSTKSGTYFVAGNDEAINAVKAVRISFVIDDGSIAKIYEPNFDAHNDAGGTTFATNRVDTSQYGPKKYSAIQQKSGDLSFSTTVDNSTDYKLDTDTKLGTITEGTPLKVTMYVWFEGMDDDCVSEIALTQIVGQIQFRAEEQEPNP